VKISLSAKLSEDYKGAVLLLFEILTFNKPCLTLSKVNSLNLNLRKGQLVGAKMTLRKKHLFDFLERLLLELLPLSKKPKIKCTKGKYGQFQFKELFALEDTNLIYIYLQGVTSIDVVIETSSGNSNLFWACRLPINKK
jgi:ribosomal protein L5